MKNVFVALLLSLGLVGCGKGTEVVLVPTPSATPGVAPVQCEVYTGRATLPSVHDTAGTYTIGLQAVSLQEVADDTKPFAEFVGTAAEVVTNTFALKCKLTYTVKVAGAHKFSLNSDDGSALYIDGSQKINNSGSHAMTLKTATVTFTAAQVGQHEVVVLYQEGNGPKGLLLSVQEPNTVITPPVSNL